MTKPRNAGIGIRRSTHNLLFNISEKMTRDQNKNIKMKNVVHDALVHYAKNILVLDEKTIADLTEETRVWNE